MRKELFTISRLSYALGASIDEICSMLSTNPFIGYSNNKYAIDDYDSLSSESMEYEINVIIKGRYRK